MSDLQSIRQQSSDASISSSRSGKSSISSKSLHSEKSFGTITSLKSNRSSSSLSRASTSNDTFRTGMSTIRVQTAIAALNEEKKNLLLKLSQIDTALENEEKKKVIKPRVSTTIITKNKKI